MPPLTAWIGFAAAPVFAALALLTGSTGGGALDSLCAGASPFGGMSLMYGLMAAVHSGPWIRLIRSGAPPVR